MSDTIKVNGVGFNKVEVAKMTEDNFVKQFLPNVWPHLTKEEKETELRKAFNLIKPKK